jgi:hypothetical protein
MIVEDFADIHHRLRTLRPLDDETASPCPLHSERNSEYRDCRRQCGQIIHGVTRTCDGSCHIGC